MSVWDSAKTEPTAIVRMETAQIIGVQSRSAAPNAT